MALTRQVQVNAKDGTDFYVQLAAFAFEGFIDAGLGCVVIHQSWFIHYPDGRVDAGLTYLPYDLENEDFPAEAVEMIDEYEPESEVVLAVVDSQDKALCIRLTTQKLGCSPATAFMKGRDWHVAIEPGSVLRLTESAGDAERCGSTPRQPEVRLVVPTLVVILLCHVSNVGMLD